MTTLCFLWHMHQPFYKDLLTGRYKLPWTRLHALKDYAGMVQILEEFPEIRQTFNLVPSMVMQIEEYALGTASDPFLDCAVRPAEDLSEAERNFVLRYFFQANPHHMIDRYPRYRELFEKRANLSIADLRDLQVLSQLVWFDEDLLVRDREVAALAGKGRDYTWQDQTVMARKQQEALANVLPVYRKFSTRGQIEIGTTPFYHPILPLLCDSDIAGVPHPGVPLPTRFQYPQDARQQLLRARSYIQEKLGAAPCGLWPSEGSVSDHALALAAECGFTWAASDNGVLARTLGRDAGPDMTYRAYIWRQSKLEMRMLFRDHFLSDQIGFVYSRMPAAEAAEHFLNLIRQNVGGDSRKDALVPIILDGENAWEWYPANGRPFLRELYRRISEDPEMEALTVSEALARANPEPLQGIFPGSWINANFDVWIGAEEDNRAWEMLLAARKTYDEALHVHPASRKLAYEELLIAEGSDWCWWYGPEHHSDNREEFDELYREHLSNVYRALGKAPPAELARPILQSQQGELHEAPKNPIQVTLDGEVTNSFEWMGAGHYRPDVRFGAMHGGIPVLHEIFYGTDGKHLFVRLDGAGEAVFSVEFERGPVAAEVAVGRIVELRVPLAGRRFRVQVSQNGLDSGRFPPNSWIELPE
jgi:alpha-amylase/alpha-mannosidase (GH57 family)